LLAVTPALAQSPDPFQSNGGPTPPPRPASPPRVTRPVPEPETPPPPVAQGKVFGVGGSGKDDWKVQGWLSPDGSFTGMHGSQLLTGSFQGRAFSGSYTSTVPSCGQRTITMQRVPAQ